MIEGTPFRWPNFVDIKVSGAVRRFQRSSTDSGKFISPGGYWCLEGGTVVAVGYSFKTMEDWAPAR